MREVTRDIWNKMLTNNCNKSKHKLRINKYGVCWCVICGLLSNSNNAPIADENDVLLIK